MRQHEADNVLFVNIGWAERYNGTQEIHGDFAYIRANDGDPDRISEGNAFWPDQGGQVSCGAGIGRVAPDRSIDVVFVARNPRTSEYQIVGIYFEPHFEYEEITQQTGGTYLWANAMAGLNSFREFLGGDRIAIEWPRGRHQRRWARKLEHGRGRRPRRAVRFPELVAAYNRLIAAP